MEELKLFEAKIISCFYETTGRTKLICARTKEEAQKIFEAWKHDQKQRFGIDYALLNIKVLRRSKRNEHYYKRYLDEDYYKKCLEKLERFNNEYEQSEENVQKEM